MKMSKKLREFFTLTRRAEGGFTLIELIVVIAIVAILGGVAVPAYSGYVAKADATADKQLLADVNKAFAAACMVEGIDNYKADSASASLTAEKTVGEVTINGKNITATFDKFYEGGAFKKTTELEYKAAEGRFIDPAAESGKGGGAYGKLQFAAELIELVKNSAFITAEGLGVENLMDKVDFITNLAASLADQTANDGEGNGAWQMLSKYNQALLDDLGITFPENYDELSDEEKAAVMAPLANLVNEKIAVLDKQNIAGWDEMDDDAKNLYAQNQILANYAVLDAAKQMKGQNADDVLASIKSTSNFTQLIKDSDNGVSQAAAAYGLYTAYAHSISDPVEREKAIAKTNDPVNLLKAMDDPGFRGYLDKPEAKTDLEGYMAAMEMVDSSASDEDAVHSLMVNGFTDPELLAVIQQAMK